MTKYKKRCNCKRCFNKNRRKSDKRYKIYKVQQVSMSNNVNIVSEHKTQPLEKNQNVMYINRDGSIIKGKITVAHTKLDENGEIEEFYEVLLADGNIRHTIRQKLLPI